MVVVKVSAHDGQHRLPFQHLNQYALPHGAALLGVQPGVYHHPSVAVAQQVEVDVIQTER
ncbi:hypothetical protein D3C78_1301950 [compost metagenome]